MSLIISLAMFGAPALALPARARSDENLPICCSEYSWARFWRTVGSLDAPVSWASLIRFCAMLPPAAAGAAGADLADEVADALVELPGESDPGTPSPPRRCRHCRARPARPRASCS